MSSLFGGMEPCNRGVRRVLSIASVSLKQRSASLSSKEPDAKYLGFAGHTTSLTTIPQCHNSTKAATDTLTHEKS